MSAQLAVAGTQYKTNVIVDSPNTYVARICTNDGSVLYKYVASHSPRVGEYIFMGEQQAIVKEVCHVLKPLEETKDGEHLWVEVGVEFIA